MNEVKVVVTGQYRPSGAVAALKKDLAELAKYSEQLERAARKSKKELDDGFKGAGNSADMAKEAIKKLGEQADRSFDKVKEKMEEAFKEADKERTLKIRAEFDKNRLKNSFDGLGGFDIDITKGFGPKIAAAVGKAFDAVGKGVDLAQAGVKSAGSFVSGLGDGLKAQHPAVQGAVYASVIGAVALAAPLIGGALAGGIIAGFGAGIGGLGVVVAAQNGKVRNSFSTMWNGVVADTQARSAVIEGVLIRTAGRAQTAWSQTGHMLTNAFGNIAPGLEKLFDGLLQTFQRFAPALEPIASAASAVFKDLGGRLPGIIGEIADSFTSLASSVEKNPEALGDFIASIGEILEIGVGFLGLLNDLHEGNKMFLDQISKPLEWAGLKETGDAVGKVGEGMLKVSKIAEGPAGSLRAAFEGIAKAGDDAAAKIDHVRQILDILNGQTPQYTDALGAAADAVTKLGGAFDESKERANGYAGTLLNAAGVFDVTTQNGRLLYQNVRDVTDAFGGMGAAVADGQMSREQFIADAGRMRDRLNETWRQAGLTEAQIVTLNEKYGLTPDQLLTMVRLSGASEAEAQLVRLARERWTTIHTQIQTYGGYVGNVNGQPIFHDRAHGGVVSSFAHGGVVSRAAAGGVRSSNVVVNDWGSQSHGEAIRLPQGSTVIPASMTRSMESRWGTDRGAGQAGLIQVSVTLDGKVLATELVDPMKGVVRKRGGDPGVFG